jgi:hypothetical protein
MKEILLNNYKQFTFDIDAKESRFPKRSIYLTKKLPVRETNILRTN